MMFKIVLLVLALQLLNSYCTAYTVDANGNPSFCKGVECPYFTKSYEVREYEATTWVETEETTRPYDEVKLELILKLIRYRRGNNADAQQIDATVPVVSAHNKITNGSKRLIYLPKCINHPPQPNDSTLTITSFPASTIYVRSFIGTGLKEELVAQEALLAQSLESDGVSYDNSLFYSAGYDDFRVPDRYFELWLLPLPY